MAALLQAPLWLAKSLVSVVSSLTGTHASSTDSHLTISHAPYLVLYRGSDTYVPVTVLKYNREQGRNNKAIGGASGQVQVALVRRGWRCGIFGWTVGKWLGAKTVKGMDVTPETEHGRPDSKSSLEGKDSASGKAPTAFPEKQLETYEKQVQRYLQTAEKAEDKAGLQGETPLSELKPVATHIVRVPAAAQDGYFRLVFKHSDGSIATSPDFRVYSISLSSACPRGAAFLPPSIIPELLLRAISTALTAILLGLFPLAALLEKILPRKMTRGFMQWAYRKSGAQEKQKELEQKYQVTQRYQKVKTDVFEMVPFAGAGIRTDYDLQKDEEYGVGGVTYWR